MHTNQKIPNRVLTFSQWSRKNYAIFVSLKKVIKIARLSVDLCVTALLKGKSSNSQFNFKLEFDKPDEEFVSDELTLQDIFLSIMPVKANISVENIPNNEDTLSTYNKSPLSASSWQWAF